MEWPDTLKLDPGAKKALERAVETNPIAGTWPEGTKFMNADQARSMADVLIPAFHPHLTNARVAYLFKQHVGGRGVTLYGKASLASAKLKHLSDVDFVVELNHSIWLGASIPLRTAMVDHELSHCGTDDSENFCMIQHDIEEFYGIVQRWGPYHQGITQMKQVLNAQLELVPA